jgi:dynamin 1-like protein
VTDLRKKIEHYYQLVIRTVRDNIPKLIGHFLVRGSQNDMLLELQDNLMQNQDYLDVISEPIHIVQERTNLKREVAVLKNA